MEIFVHISQLKINGFDELRLIENAEEYVKVFIEKVRQMYFFEAFKILPVTKSIDDFGESPYVVHAIVGGSFSAMNRRIKFVPDDDMLCCVEKTFELWKQCDERLRAYCTGGLRKWMTSCRQRAVLKGIKKRHDGALLMQDIYSAAISLFVRKNLGTPDEFAAKAMSLVSEND